MITAIGYKAEECAVKSTQYFSARTQAAIENKADEWGAVCLEFPGMGMVWRKVEGEWVATKG